MGAARPSSILTSPRQRCCVCGGEGRALYSGLTDILFSAPGHWSVSQCTNDNCGLLWLDPMPLAEEIHKAYAKYSTHADIPDRPVSMLRRRLRKLGRHYLAWRYGYPSTDQRGWKMLLGWLISLHPTASAAVDLEVFHLPRMSGGR